MQLDNSWIILDVESIIAEIPNEVACDTLRASIINLNDFESGGVPGGNFRGTTKTGDPNPRALFLILL